jgi:hypothetical protein
VRQLSIERGEHIQELLDAMPDAVLIVGTDGRVLSVSAQAEAMFGYARQELIGEEIEILVPERFRPAHRGHRNVYALAPATRAMGTGLDLRARRRDGSEFPVDVSLGAVESAGRPLVVAVVRDVTERVAVLTALRESQQQYRMIVEGASEVFYRVSIQDDPLRGRLEFVSPQCRTVTGYGPEQFLDDPGLWAASIHPDDRGAVAETTRAVLVSKAPQARYYRVRDREGRYHWIADRIVPIVNSDGRVTGYQGVARDVTERAEADEQRRSLEAQLAQSQKIEAIGRLAGGVAHDFNNLLTVILGVTGELLEQPRAVLPAGIRGDVEMIRDAGERGAALTQQLLAFARQQVVRPTVLDMNAVVVGLETLFRRLIEESIELQCVLASDLGRVRADAGQIEQILVNLVVNARDAMPVGGTLTIETANAELDAEYAREHVPVVPGRYMMLAVSDTGAGIPPEVHARLFEPFFTTKTLGRGTGLGLATVYGIVKQSGGYIWAYSEPNQGSTFKIYLPLVDEPATTHEPVDSRTEPPTGTETVLLVDDNDAVRAIASRALRRYGYTVLEARNAEDALQLAATHAGPLHLLLTDVVMPGMSGQILARRLAEEHPGLKLIYMSGYAENAISRYGILEAGANLLQKPFTPKALGRIVRTVLDTSTTGRTTQ